MCEIRNAAGEVVQRSRNLAGIRRYVGCNLIKMLAIDEVGNGEGKLSILFDNGSSFETNFASYVVLAGFVNRWRNVRGAPFMVNGEPKGTL